MIYRLLVLAHLAGVVLFFGNLAIAFGLMLGTRNVRDVRVLTHGYRLLHRLDTVLTPASLVLLFGGGIGAAKVAGLELLQPWVTRPSLALGVSGIAFIATVLPAQRALAEGRGLGGGEPDAEHARLRRRWLAWATASTVAAFTAVVLMVLGSPR